MPIWQHHSMTTYATTVNKASQYITDLHDKHTSFYYSIIRYGLLHGVRSGILKQSRAILTNHINYSLKVLPQKRHREENNKKKEKSENRRHRTYAYHTAARYCAAKVKIVKVNEEVNKASAAHSKHIPV